MNLRACAVFAAAIGWAAHSVCGDSVPVVGEKIGSISLESAAGLHAAIRISAAEPLIVVVFPGPTVWSETGSLRVEGGLGVREWLAKHALTMVVPEVSRSGGSATEPLVFCAGRRVPLVGASQYSLSAVHRSLFPSLPALDVPGADTLLLLRLAFTLESLRQTDPKWAARHEQAVAKDGIGRVDPDIAPNRAVDILRRLDEARAAANRRDWSKAAGLYAWLWEQGPRLDPAFGPAALTLLIPDLRAAARASDTVRFRLMALRDARQGGLADESGLRGLEWFALNSACTDQPRAAEQLSGLLMLPMWRNGEITPFMTSRRSLSTFAASLATSPDAAISRRNLEKLRKVVESLEPKKNADAATPSKEVRIDGTTGPEVARTGLLGELCASHAALLRAGRVSDAMALGALFPAESRGALRSLVYAAAMVGELRPAHGQWLALVAATTDAVPGRTKVDALGARVAAAVKSDE